MNNTKRVVAVTMAAGGFLAAGAGAASAHDGASAHGVAAHSPGVISGNVVQVPIHVPINICGNTVNIVGALNPAIGNKCENS